MPELVFLRRGEEVLRFTLDRPRVVVGRGDRCDVVIPDPEVSRQQALLLVSGDTAVVEDLSGKGTIVGGARAQRAPLGDGAEIALGQWRAIFRARSASTDDGPETEVRGTVAQQRADADSGRVQPAQIRLRHGGTETVQRLVGEGFTLGKDPGNDLVLDDRFISGKHLRITRRGTRFLVLDHASTNGTWLGPVRLFEAEVPLHTQLRVGESEVLLEPATPDAARRSAGVAGPGRAGLRDAPADRPHRAGGPVVRGGDRARRVGHRQGAGGAGDPRPQLPRRASLRPGQLRGDQQGAHRERAVRPREGRVHRRRRRAQGRLRGGGRGHAVPRRDRRPPVRPPGQAAPGARVRRDQARRLEPPHPRGRAGGGRDQPRSLAGQPLGAVPRRPLLPALRRSADTSAPPQPQG